MQCVAGAVRSEAIVLRAMKYGEADRILHVFTPEHGRRSVIARGARKQKSKLGGRLEPPSHVELQLHEGRGEIATVTGADTIAALPRLRERLDSIDAALHACDDVGRLFGDGEPHEGVFHLLVNHLVGLDAEPEAATGGRAISFRLKLLLAAGIAPELGSCAGCGAIGREPVAFSAPLGGMLCGECASRGRVVERAVVEALQQALASPLAAAPTPPVRTARQIDQLLIAIGEAHLDARLRPLPDPLLRAGT